MASSDDSFAWTSASSVSGDSDAIGDKTMNGDQYIEESDSGKSYKRKLRKQLFNEQENETVQSPPTDGPPLHSRVKHEATSDERAGSEEEASSLRRRVKQENGAPTPRKKKKRRETDTQPIIDNSEEMKIEKTHRKSKISHCSDDNTTLTSLVKEENRKAKSKKLRKKRDSEATDYNGGDMIIEEKFSAEDTIIQTPNKRSKENETNKIQNSYSSKEFISDESSSDEDSAKEDKSNQFEEVNSAKNQGTDERTKGSGSDYLENGISHENENLLVHTNNTTTKTSRKISKLSDRIQFEDEEDLATNHNDSFDKSVWSSRFKRFLRSRSHLKSNIPEVGHESSITNDDEIWILRCPREMDIMSLRNTDLSLDSKCKIKIDGQTFNGSIDEQNSKVAILSFAHNRAVINNVSSNGIVQFRKRIPKIHIVEDNITMNNQINFIPLPDTKSRHPLFGSNYKKAMKIPKLIRTRLKESDTEREVTSLETKKKKKHKRETSPNATPPRAHKRPLSSADEHQPVRKKKKRSKPDSIAAEAWDSEKAIEENLFNF